MNNPEGVNTSHMAESDFFDSASGPSDKLELTDIHRQIVQSLSNFTTTITEQQQKLKENLDDATAITLFTEDKANKLCLVERSFLYYERLQEMIITELRNWRRQQALAANGAQFNEDNLDEIQRCFELLENFINQLLAAIEGIPKEDEEIAELRERMQLAQKYLLGSALIVVKQPPQVMMTNTRFAVTVRWLLGSQPADSLNPLTIVCNIFSEWQAKHFVDCQDPHLDVIKCRLSQMGSGELQNNSSIMEYQTTKQIFCANFNNMLLKKITRSKTDKKNTNSVMDEKFTLFFYATYKLNGNYVCTWSFSLPVVVIVHSRQEPKSWATIIWDNAFANVLRDPFVVSHYATWLELSAVLNMKFTACTQRQLTADNLAFLHEKLMGRRFAYITWNEFCKNPLPERTFTFWEWFYSVMKLIKDHLMPLWKANLITGFITKHRTQFELLCAEPGTFLLRFSESKLGGISIAYVNEQQSVTMLSPWAAQDLRIIKLADRIRDLPMLRFLFRIDNKGESLDRDDAFGQFYSQSALRSTRTNGYVPSTIHVDVPGNRNLRSIKKRAPKTDEQKLFDAIMGMENPENLDSSENFT
ncbi:signal transducer and transcription activator-like [Drosophila nasuta]|uniref:signal transducer and transcription activator-like n=1 Tax=Drosophila nasuta TaxID=42062 RepID=UPI00295E94CA|nr:signal transducer and transcription activator-like [Drosophila nasuta]